MKCIGSKVMKSSTPNSSFVGDKMDNDKFNKILEESNKALNRAWEIAVAANVERRELTAEEQAEIDFNVAKSRVPLSAFKDCHIED